MKTKHYILLAVGIVVLLGGLTLFLAARDPVWYRMQAAGLVSNDTAVAGAALKRIVAEGRGAVPYIRQWLKSSDRKLFISACRVLENARGDFWLDLRPELEYVLDGTRPDARTDAAGMVFWKRAADKKSFSGMPEFRRRLIYAAALKFDKNERTKRMAASEISRILNRDLVPRLIEVLRNDGSATVRFHAASMLAMLEDGRAIDVLAERLVSDTDSAVRGTCASALVYSKSVETVAVLKKALLSDTDVSTRGSAAVSLGLIAERDNRTELVGLLEREAGRGNRGAAAAVAWIKGGEERLRRELARSMYFRMNVLLAYVRWGGKRYITDVVEKLENNYRFMSYYYDDILKRMPAGMPKYDSSADAAVRKTQVERMLGWLGANRDRIRWDGAGRRYNCLP